MVRADRPTKTLLCHAPLLSVVLILLLWAASTLMKLVDVTCLARRRMAARSGCATMLHVEDLGGAMTHQRLLQRFHA